MNTRREAALPPIERRTTPSVPREAAETAQAIERMTRRRSSAWDPYEVWKTRVKVRTTSG